MKKQILIVGGIHETVSLANSLIKKGYKVTVINESPADCELLLANEKINVILGDGTKPGVLKDAGANFVDIAIAMTKSDAENLVVCELCKKTFNVRKTVSIVTDEQKLDFFKNMGIDSVVCSAKLIGDIVEKHALVDDITASVSIGDGSIKVSEVIIPASSPVVDKSLLEIALPQGSIVGCILRNKQTIIPKGDTVILGDDRVVIIVSENKEGEVIRALTGQSSL